VRAFVRSVDLGSFSRAAACDSAAWFKIGDFWVTRTRRNGRVLKPAFDRRVVVCGRPVGLPGSHLLGLKRAEAQQRQPVRMAFVCEQFPRAVSGSLGALAAYETTVV
jgi:hypothetical protein